MVTTGFFVAPRMRPLARVVAGMGLWMGMSCMAWGMDLQQAYDAAVENDATIRAAAVPAGCRSE